jgi:hypothetical protein
MKTRHAVSVPFLAVAPESELGVFFRISTLPTVRRPSGPGVIERWNLPTSNLGNWVGGVHT